MDQAVFSAFLKEAQALSYQDSLEKDAVYETARVGGKAVWSALRGGTKLKAAPGAFLPERQQAVQHGERLMSSLREGGVKVHRARVKSPSSIQAGGHTTVPDDLLGMQFYAKDPAAVAAAVKKLEAAGVTGIQQSAKVRPGYRGVNIKGTYQGTPIELQASPGRMSNVGQMMEHSLGYKPALEAPRSNWFDRWFGQRVAPRMVSSQGGWLRGLQAAPARAPVNVF